MPIKNGTGPEGKGPGTGRGMGNCVPENKIDESGKPFGRQRKIFGSGLERRPDSSTTDSNDVVSGKPFGRQRKIFGSGLERRPGSRGGRGQGNRGQ